MSHDARMPGDYEYRALTSGSSMQRQWNRNRLTLLSCLKFITKKDIVLDAGCGSGNVVIKFAKSAKRIEGWDINKNSIDFLNNYIKKREIKNAKASIKNLVVSKGDPEFSKVILTEVIEHFAHENYTKMLRNMNKVMLPGGQIFITTPNDKSIWPILDFLLNFMQKYVQRIPTFHERHLGHFNKKKLEKDVVMAGFTIRRKGTMNAFSPFLFFLPTKIRDTVCIWESNHIQFGPLLYVVAEKK